MTIATRVHTRISELAVGRHLPHRIVRLRLTLLYGGLFLLSGAALMAITYVLLVNAGFVFTLNNGVTHQRLTQPSLTKGAPRAPGFPAAGSTTRPSAQTMVYWRGVTRCMRQHGVSSFPEPTTSVPSNHAFIGDLSDRDGAILVFPATINTQSASFVRAASTCGYLADSSKQIVQDNRQRTQSRQELLLQSAIALAAMSLLSIGLGWIVAGRVLQPLEDSYQAQRQFVANASHELRAPLTRQRALIQVALADPDANFTSLRATHERVLVAEQHLEQMIDGLLTLSRGQAGLERREPLNLATLTSNAMHACETELESRDLDVHATLATAPTAGDPRLVERLITNLLDNAIHHNIPGGYVEITTGTSNRRAFVSVANTGPTVPSQQIQRLFEPFQRLSGRTHHNSGHGLGLSIVQAIANAHRAELTATARPDGGLTIEVSFAPPTGPTSGITLAAAGSKPIDARATPRDRRSS
jgi:signal transduction histidine kinase